MKNTITLALTSICALLSAPSHADSPFNDINERLDALSIQIENMLDGAAIDSDLRLVRATQVLSGNDSSFSIITSCDQPFRVEAIIVVSNDPTGTVTIQYTGATITGTAFWPPSRPNAFAFLGHTPITALAAQFVAPGIELLSSMKIQRVSLPEGAELTVHGVRTPNTQVTTMTIDSVIATSTDQSNTCSIQLVDD